MQQLLALFGLFLLFLAMAGDAPETSDRYDRLSTEQELTALEHKLAEASLRGDAAFMESVMAEDFVGIDASGRQLNRAQVLERMHQPDYQVQALRHEEVRVHAFGDCVVAMATTVLEARYKGQAISGRFPYTRVWLKRAGRWQAVFTQSTPPQSSAASEDHRGGRKPHV